jgi:hypothetical protein
MKQSVDVFVAAHEAKERSTSDERKTPCGIDGSILIAAGVVGGIFAWLFNERAPTFLGYLGDFEVAELQLARLRFISGIGSLVVGVVYMTAALFVRQRALFGGALLLPALMLAISSADAVAIFLRCEHLQSVEGMPDLWRNSGGFEGDPAVLALRAIFLVIGPGCAVVVWKTWTYRGTVGASKRE